MLAVVAGSCSRLSKDSSAGDQSDGRRELPLMPCARTGYTSWHYLAPVRHEATQALVVFVVDSTHLLEAQLAVLSLGPTARTLFCHLSILSFRLRRVRVT